MKRGDEDPYADLIAANIESLKSIYEEGLRRALKALEKGFPTTAELTIRMALCFHPMHAEDWPGWPLNPWEQTNQAEG